MARTQGHGNPAWTRDETILALDLYFESGGRVGPADERLVELSQLLRSLPYHAAAARQPTFRNPAGVAFKIQNLRQVATGRGLGNVSQMDRDIWVELGERPDEVGALADLVRAGIAALGENPDELDDDDDDEFYEGRLLTRQHRVRERNPRLRARLLQLRRHDGLVCDICGATHEKLPPELRESAFEAHHVLPVSVAGERKTRVEDLALLCATCHRLVHRAIAVRRTWLSVMDVRAWVLSRNAREC